MSGPLVVIGDALLDVDLDGGATRLAPDAPVPVIAEPEERDRPGGAGLAALLAAAHRQVTLVTALAPDDAGRRLRELLEAAHVIVVNVGADGTTPRKVRLRAGGHSVARMDYGKTDVIGDVTAEAEQAIATATAVLVSDYGRGLSAQPGLRRAVARAKAAVVWDPHPRGAEPVAGVRLVTPNRAEVDHFTGSRGGDLSTLCVAAETLLARWEATGVAVTLGAGGALLVTADGTLRVVTAPLIASGDACGAGDSFAVAAGLALAAGALPSEAVEAAVAAASAFVAGGGASSVMGMPLVREATQDAHDLARGVRAAGGTVVATGGCFDLLHAGHVETLAAARRLGDCLIVCLNSDDSVRRLKGPGRPLVGSTDRVAVVRALSSVDSVAVFDEDTPERLLAQLRPHLWVKGGDYLVADLPEAAALSTWGGQAIVLPYLDGRSTTRLIEEASARAHH